MFPYDDAPRPKVPFEKIDDYSPDAHPSFSQCVRERQGEGSDEEIKYALVVRGCGVMIVKMNRKDKSIKVCEFLKAELGYSPNI